jgi:UDP-glucose 4-epimerase
MLCDMGRVLVTGAAGFIGSHTVEALIERGADVCGVDNLRTGHLANLDAVRSAPGFRFEQIDILEKGKLDSIAKSFQPDAIIHLAALVSVQESMDDPDLNFLLNVEGTHRIGVLAKDHSVRQVVFASSAATFGETNDLPVTEETPKNSISPYGAAKYAGEALLQGYARSYGFGACCFRYFNVYGPRQDPRSPYSGVISIFADRYRDGKSVMVFGDGGQTRDFVFVKDVAGNNADAALSDQLTTGSFNVCTGRPATLLDIIQVFESHYPGAPKPVFKEARKGDIVHSYGTPKHIHEVLGFQAKHSIETGLKCLIDSLDT